MLENHAEQQQQTIDKLNEEIKCREQAEEALSNLNKELEQRVEQRTHDLTAANAELKSTLNELKQTQKKLLEADKMAALGGLVAGVAHEINTPVGIVLTAVSHMNEHCHDIVKKLDQHTLTAKQLHKFTDELEQGFDLAINNINRAAKQIESFKKVAVDSSADKVRSFNLNTYIDDILLSLKPKYKNRNIEIKLNCKENIQINNYPGAVAQIISNLISNSLIHAFDEDQSGHIKINVEQKVDKIELEYKDDGRGLDSEGIETYF